MNESLRRALLRARLREEDVAARLGVDPKTVHRWLEGRVPYLRHRWALASMLGSDEAALWPQLNAALSRPEEIQAIYPHRDDVPAEVWRTLFTSAERHIDILTVSGLFLTADQQILTILDDRARAGVEVRICVRDPGAPDHDIAITRHQSNATSAGRIHEALAWYQPLQSGFVKLRLYRTTLLNSIYRTDDKLLISQHAYGVSDSRAPTLYLERTRNRRNDMVEAYMNLFTVTWMDAIPFTYENYG